MARGFGMTALRAALGGVGGYYEGVSAEREARRLEERQRELDRIGMLDKGYMTPEQAGAAKRTGGAAVLRAALMGARDQAAIDQGLSAAAPQQTTTFGGQQYTRETPFSKAAREASRALYEEQEKKKRERADLQQERVRARLEKQYGDEQRVQALMATGEYTEPQARAEVFGGSEAYKPMSQQERDASARGWEALRQAAEKKDEDRGEVANGLQAMGVARASSALNLLESNNRRMEQFESDVLSGKAKVTALQMEAARIAMSGQPGAALAEAQLAKGIPMVMPANAKLLQYVRSAKGIAGAVREITPRGGSNLMMQMETALSGIGPGGVDAESIEQVREFRRDQLLGVREGVMALRGQRPGQQTEQATTKESTVRTRTQAKPVNPYR
jgi:hypothetical protein